MNFELMIEKQMKSKQNCCDKFVNFVGIFECRKFFGSLMRIIKYTVS